MKKIVLFAAMMLLGAVQNVNAQNETEYSLEGIGKALSKLNVASLGDFHEGLAWVCVRKGVKNCKGFDEWYGYIDAKGKMVVPCVYVSAKDFSDGLACVCNDDWKYGFIDKQGNIAIPFTFDEHTGSFSEGLAYVRQKEESTGYINKRGELAIPYIKNSYGGSFGGGIAPIRIGHDETYYIDTHGNVVIPTQSYRSYHYVDSFYVVRSKNRRFGVIDLKGNYVFQDYNEINGFSEGLFVVGKTFEKKDESGFSSKTLYGFVDTKGRETISPQYEDARLFSEGFAAVQMGKKWGYININGELIIPYKFNEAYEFHDGLAFVKTDSGYAIIDKQGNTISKLPNYDSFWEPFSEGLVVIKQNGKWGYVDIYGNSTFNPNAMIKTRTNANPNPKESTTIGTEGRSNEANDSPLNAPSSFPGGKAAMKQFIARTMRYPAEAVKKGMQGTLPVAFTVEEDGSLTNIYLKRNAGPYLNKEALRIVSLMPKWIPAIKDGVKVKSTQTVEIVFRLR